MVKTHQKEMQTAKLELGKEVSQYDHRMNSELSIEQIERDIISAQENIEQAGKATGKLQKEHESMVKELKVTKVRLSSRV